MAVSTWTKVFLAAACRGSSTLNRGHDGHHCASASSNAFLAELWNCSRASRRFLMRLRCMNQHFQQTGWRLWGLASTATSQFLEELDGILVGIDPLAIAAHARKEAVVELVANEPDFVIIPNLIELLLIQIPQNVVRAAAQPHIPILGYLHLSRPRRQTVPSSFLEREKVRLGEDLAIHFVKDDLRGCVLHRRKLHRPRFNT